jgi:hypothetical protein
MIVQPGDLASLPPSYCRSNGAAGAGARPQKPPIPALNMSPMGSAAAAITQRGEAIEVSWASSGADGAGQPGGSADQLPEGIASVVRYALTTIVGTVLLAAATSSVVSGGVRAASTAAGGAVQAATSGVSGYSVDALFRSDHIDASASNQDVAAQASRILANGVRNGDVPPGDRTYLAQLVAAKTGIPQADAQKRVDDTIASTKEAETKARQAADAARKATATFAIFTALSLMIGAFVASAAAAFGGNIRDEY